jgi:hypothetical protein
MADVTTKRYERLPGTGYRRMVPAWAMILLFFVIGIFVLLLRGRRVQLWLGDDHLLVVDWDGYREYYKRFRYEDIQTVIIQRTTEGKIVNAILGGVALLFAAIALAVTDQVGVIFCLIIGGVFGVLLLVNLLSGPTCRCQLRTAVQSEELHSLTRFPTARKALDRLRPRIVAAQGALTATDVLERWQSLAVEASPVVSQPAMVDDPNAPPQIAS